MNWTLVIIIAVMVLAVFIYSVLVSGKKRWYKVYLANNDVMLLYRDLNERWWRTNDRFFRFKNEVGKEVSFPTSGHWILFMEEVTDLVVAREEIRNMKIDQSKQTGD
jgi:hypothetical protein